LIHFYKRKKKQFEDAAMRRKQSVCPWYAQ